MTTGYWLLATFYRLQATGYYSTIQATGYRLHYTVYRLQDTGYWLLVTGYRLLATGYWLLLHDTGYMLQAI